MTRDIESCVSRTLTRRLVIRNERGLHARAAAKIAQLTGQFQSTVMIRRGDMEVSSLSIMGLLILGASCGSEIEVCVSGVDSEGAMGALRGLVERGFDEG